MRKALEGRLLDFGSGLPRITQKRIMCSLWNVLFFDWSVTLFTIGYALILLCMTPLGPSMGVLQGPLIPAFEPWVVAYALTMLTAGVIGTIGLWRRNRNLRMGSSWLLVLAYLWLAIYYMKAIPLPWPAVYVYTFHAGLEALVYVRTATDPHHVWES